MLLIANSTFFPLSISLSLYHQILDVHLPSLSAAPNLLSFTQQFIPIRSIMYWHFTPRFLLLPILSHLTPLLPLLLPTFSPLRLSDTCSSSSINCWVYYVSPVKHALFTHSYAISKYTNVPRVASKRTYVLCLCTLLKPSHKWCGVHICSCDVVSNCDNRTLSFKIQSKSPF